MSVIAGMICALTPFQISPKAEAVQELDEKVEARVNESKKEKDKDKARTLINHKNDRGETLLHQAAALGSKKSVMLLTRNKADVNVMDNDGNRPLHLASAEGTASIIKHLIGKDAEVDARNYKNETALHKAAEANKTNAFDTLLRHKNSKLVANIPSNESPEGTPLHWAAARGHTGIVRLILRNKAAITVLNYKNSKGETPLYLAATNGHNNVVRLLANNNANMDLTTLKNESPLQAAVRLQFPDIVNTLQKEKHQREADEREREQKKEKK